MFEREADDPDRTSAGDLDAVTTFLVQLSNRFVPASSDDVLRAVKPASFFLARRSSDELGLAMLWGGLSIGAMVLMGVLTIAGGGAQAAAGRLGLQVGFGVCWSAWAGVSLHGARYLIAEYSGRAVERRYRKRAGRSSMQDAATGQAVAAAVPRIRIALTRSTRWDLVVQAVAGSILAILMR